MNFQNLLINLDWKNFQSILAIIGVIFAFLSYFLSRKPFPKLIQKHTVIHCFLDENILLIRVTLEITNQGIFGLDLDNSEANLRIIAPLVEHTRKNIQLFKNKHESEVEWPSIETKVINLKHIYKRIEAGETDYIFFDFILEDTEDFPYSDISIVLITTDLRIRSCWLINYIQKICRKSSGIFASFQLLLHPKIKVPLLVFKWKWYIKVHEKYINNSTKHDWWSLYFYQLILESPIKKINKDTALCLIIPYRQKLKRLTK